jgi:hypothetical protein
MFRSLLPVTALLLAPFGLLSPAALEPPPTEGTVRGRIKDVRGAAGMLLLTVGEGKEARDHAFLILDTRFVGPTGSEIKVGDLREGDVVEAALSRDGRSAREVRVLPVAPVP